MDLAEAHELSVFEPRNQSQDPGLLGESQVVLKPDQIVAIGPQVLLPKLDHGIRSAPRSRIVKPHWFHRTEAQGIAATPRELFDRQTRLEVRRAIFFHVRGYALAFEQRLHEAFILFPVEWTVRLIVDPVEGLPVPRRAKGDALIDAI